MGNFDWDQKYDVHVPAMNADHKVLLGIMARLQSEAEARKSKITLEATLRELARATTDHFAREEKYLQQIGYPDLPKHQQIHRDLLSKLNQHQTSFATSSQQSLPPEFFRFLKVWLASHIMGIDMRYGDQVKKSKVA